MADNKGAQYPPVEFETAPDRYKHWRLSVDEGIATLTMDVQEEHGLRPGYVLQQNSYDLGVDIELCDAIQRLRFQHPDVGALVVTSGHDKVFCAGANIYMLGSSSHAWKVNFCKFTNETRCGLEDLAVNSGVHTIAALNGTAAGGGYELALACSEILLRDDGNAAVSLPEVPLLGVLPGTGGLTRLVDKRHVRRDLADLFCTRAEGFRARDAKKYGLIDASFRRSGWDEGVQKSAQSAHKGREVSGGTKGVDLGLLTVDAQPLERTYTSVQMRVDEGARVAHVTVAAPTKPPPSTHEDLMSAGDQSWAIRAFRELDDALLHLRFNHPTAGLVLLHTSGDPGLVLEWDAALSAMAADGSWLAREVLLNQARTLRRLDNMSRSLFAVIDQGSCFAGVLLEVALAADRIYMLDEDGVSIRLGPVSGGAMPSLNGRTRLEIRFLHDPTMVSDALESQGSDIDASQALDLGLVTLAPDDIDWEDELRIAIEERVSLSPDALTGMEQNLRAAGGETCDTKIYGRLTAWQNWIFQRPNAVGERGALTMYGQPERPTFDFRRT